MIAGGGIGGLTLALTLHQIGVDCIVLESVREPKALGVGINLQPNAVRELEDLGLGPEKLDAIGIPAREWALVGLDGTEIYAEPRGKVAGYRWDQYAAHRGRFHLLLYQTAIDRLGASAVRLDRKATGYRKEEDGSVTAFVEDGNGAQLELNAALLVGADGIHSAIRAEMHPDQPPIHWGGTIMWRGTARGVPLRTGSSFVGLGTSRHRVILYPISHPDDQGLAEINWIAEKTYDASHDWTRTGWFRPVSPAEFAAEFGEFRYGSFDLSTLLAATDAAYENPMIDRDPLPTWVDGPVALLGDAAHPMYPTGSNGASQAIVDARVLGRQLVDHGVNERALAAYDALLCGPIGEVAMRNRGAGPFGLLDIVEKRLGGAATPIDEVISREERAAFMLSYQRAAGFAKNELNAAPPTILPGARVAERKS